MKRLNDDGLGGVRPHRVLGIRPDETDLLQIILAAQVRLRRWRRVDAEADAARTASRRRVREIVGAREAMMQRAIERAGVSRLRFDRAVQEQPGLAPLHREV
jgi:hypothetical protein